MNQSQTLEAALAEAERMLAEQNAELETAFARLESWGSSPLVLDGQELAVLRPCEPPPGLCRSRNPMTGTRC